MRILVLNGSPKVNGSNTMQITDAFLHGFCEKEQSQVERLDLYQINIKPCIGCFACWNKTPGKCCLKDDMSDILAKILDADFIIYSFPLYYFTVPSQLKAMIDRQLPMFLPFMETNNNDGGSHFQRYDLSKKRYVIISTCGFYTTESNYNAVSFQFDKMLGRGSYESIFCSQGELFRVPELKKRTGEYLQFVKAAGKEFADGAISAETKVNLSELLYPREVFEQMSDASWNIEKPGEAIGQSTKALSFTKQMAALYNKSAYSGKDIVLEMSYTDSKESYQIMMTREGHKILTKDFLPFTTKIETPLVVWQSIAKGELEGQGALMDRLYRVQGDFNLMLRWDDYFGTAITEKAVEMAANKKSNMIILIVPWFILWVLMAIEQTIGGVAAIVCSALIPFAYLRFKPTVYECISLFFTAFIGLLALLGVKSILLVPLSYLLFGIMWCITVFLKVPLTANYSMNKYGAEKALNNPLFIRTNRMLTACWGILYLITPLWTYALMISHFPWITGIVNSVLPILLGLFTMWFQRWYPAFYARKK